MFEFVNKHLTRALDALTASSPAGASVAGFLRRRWVAAHGLAVFALCGARMEAAALIVAAVTFGMAAFAPQRTDA